MCDKCSTGGRKASSNRGCELTDLPEALPTQVQLRPVDLAQPEERARSLWSQLLPALLVVMTLTGAFYPAVDVAAGEKERGTMETLLICPASRTEIVVGKFFTVMLFSVCTALLNLVSMGFTGKYIASIRAGGAMSNAGVHPCTAARFDGVGHGSAASAGGPVQCDCASLSRRSHAAARKGSTI